MIGWAEDTVLAYEQTLSALSPASLLSEPLESGGAVADALSSWGYRIEKAGRIVADDRPINREGDE